MNKGMLLLIVIGMSMTIPRAFSQVKNGRDPGNIHVVGHAHMDMNWLWTYSETMQMCNDNMRQAVAFMKEFPDYTMVQSQASVYNFVEKADPPLFEQVRRYVKEGRLEPVGGMWTEGDMDLSSGEAITRSFLLGQRYFLSRFGKMCETGWLPDNFGHISQMPQILKLAGCKSFYFHRCKPYLGTFWWVGTDSSKVLCYANDTYNGDIKPELKNDFDKFSPDKKRLLQITGVGDHGGGPTRANINMVHTLAGTPGYPSVRFTTAADFFANAAKEMDGRPVHHGEMQYIFEGCYTTVADIKAGNRDCENALCTGEFFNTLRWLQGDLYPAADFRELWTTVTFNQFHDILPGSAINEANKEAVARYSEVLRKTFELRNNAFRRIADEIKFQEEPGQPVVAFNLQPQERKALVEATVYSNNQPATATLSSWGNYYGSQYVKPAADGSASVPSLLVTDASGKKYPAQIVWGKVTPPGFTFKVQFVVDKMVPGGYKTFYVDASKPGISNEGIPWNDNTFETRFFRVKFNLETGGIASLTDKRTGKEYVKPGRELNTLRMYLENKKGKMKSWAINKIVREEDVSDVASVKVIEKGPVRACVEAVKTWGKSRFIIRTYLYNDYPRIDFDMETHWLETGSDSTDSPMLRALFPLDYDTPRFFCQVPFDVVERVADGKINGKPVQMVRHSNIYGVSAEDQDGQEVPAQKWVDVTDGKTGIALLNKTKYGHSYHRGDLRLTLMRAAGAPDIYPNLGKFNIRYALFPHPGDWKNGVWSEGEEFNVPVYAAEPPSLAQVKKHASRAEEGSFFSISAPNVILSGIKQSEEGGKLVIRLAETEGKTTSVTVSLPVPIKGAQRLNLVELPLQGTEKPEASGNLLRLKIKPHEIVTLGIVPGL